MYNLTILIIIIFFLFYLIFNNEYFSNMKHNKHNKHNNLYNNNHEACSNNISDKEYLYHMIPHHKVAIDISNELQKKTVNPRMHKILRKLIWIQKYEIEMMKEVLQKEINKVSTKDKMNNKYNPTISDLIKPNFLKISKTYCDPNFFNPEDHKKHMNNMILNEKTYIEHMIPHHQVAIDMSKKLLKNTKNDFMIYLAYRIIRNQQEEILLLNDIKKIK